MHYVIGSSSVTSPASPPNTDGTYIESNRGNDFQILHIKYFLFLFPCNWIFIQPDSYLGGYMLLDTSGSAAGQTGQLRSMRLLSSASSQCLQFSYYLDRADASSTSSIRYGNNCISDFYWKISFSLVLLSLFICHLNNGAIQQIHCYNYGWNVFCNLFSRK